MARRAPGATPDGPGRVDYPRTSATRLTAATRDERATIGRVVHSFSDGARDASLAYATGARRRRRPPRRGPDDDRTHDAAERRDALVGRLFEATLGAFDLLTLHLGDELGLYRALSQRGPLTAPELAAAGRHRAALRPGVARAAGRGGPPRRRRPGRGTRRAPVRAACRPPRSARRPDKPRINDRHGPVARRRWRVDGRPDRGLSEPAAACRGIATRTS
jgi:hypothetical protein